MSAPSDFEALKKKQAEIKEEEKKLKARLAELKKQGKENSDAMKKATEANAEEATNPPQLPKPKHNRAKLPNFEKLLTHDADAAATLEEDLKAKGTQPLTAEDGARLAGIMKSGFNHAAGSAGVAYKASKTANSAASSYRRTKKIVSSSASADKDDKKNEGNGEKK